MDLKLPNGRYPEILRDSNGREYDAVYHPDGTLLWARSAEATLRGNPLVLTHTARERVEAFTLYGRSMQTQYAGYNLTHTEWADTRTVNGLTITVSADGRIRVSGTAAATVSIPFVPFTANEGEVFYLRLDSETGKTYTDTYLQVFNGLGTDSAVCRPDAGTVKLTAKQSGTAAVRIRIAAGQNFDGETLRPMLTLTPESRWEPFVGGRTSPSPEYPQEIAGTEEPTLRTGGAAGEERQIRLRCTLHGIGDVRDSLTVYADGTGKLIRRTGVIQAYAGESVQTPYMSTAGTLSSGAKVVYALTEPETTALTADESSAILTALRLYKPTTTLQNDREAEMRVTYRKSVNALRAGDDNEPRMKGENR